MSVNNLTLAITHSGKFHGTGTLSSAVDATEDICSFSGFFEHGKVCHYHTHTTHTTLSQHNIHIRIHNTHTHTHTHTHSQHTQHALKHTHMLFLGVF